MLESLYCSGLLTYISSKQRFKLKYCTKSQNTAVQASEVVEKKIALRWRITAVRAPQAIYMPCVPELIACHKAEALLAAAKAFASAATSTVPATSLTKKPPRRARGQHTTPNDSDDCPEDQPLFLPYQLSKEQLDRYSLGLAEMENRLREAQLHNSLDKLRVQLHVKSRIVNFKA